MIEERYVDPVTGGEKGTKTARYDLIPAEPLLFVAECFGRGAAKYSDRNWERGVPWSLNFAALNRHLWAWWAGETHDPEGNFHHLAAVCFHALALMEFERTHPELDDRYWGATP